MLRLRMAISHSTSVENFNLPASSRAECMIRMEVKEAIRVSLERIRGIRKQY